LLRIYCVAATIRSITSENERDELKAHKEEKKATVCCEVRAVADDGLKIADRTHTHSQRVNYKLVVRSIDVNISILQR